jgi:ABC-type thiamine transport system substrate-binding protein
MTKELKAQVKVNMSNLGEGTELEIPGLGVFKNGETAEVGQDQLITFLILNAHDTGDLNDPKHSESLYQGNWVVPALDDLNLPEGVEIILPKAVQKELENQGPVVSASAGDPVDGTEKGGE